MKRQKQVWRSLIWISTHGLGACRNFDFKTSLVKWRCWFYFHWSVGHPHSSGYKILYSPIKFLETWLAYGLVNFWILRLRGDFSVSVNRLRLSTILWNIYSFAGKNWSRVIYADYRMTTRVRETLKRFRLERIIKVGDIQKSFSNW